MEYQVYLDQKKEIYESLYQFIKEDQEDQEDQEESEKNFQGLILNIKKQNIQESKDELEIFLRLWLSIFNHHHRYSNFSIKMLN